MGSILQPNVSGMIQLSHGEAYVPHDKGNGNTHPGLTLVGSEWQLRSKSGYTCRIICVTSTRSVDQDVLSPSEAAKFLRAVSRVSVEGDGQLAFKKLATATLETLMPRIESKENLGRHGGASLCSTNPKGEVQLGKRLQASVVRQMKDSEMAMQWTLTYQLSSRLRILFQSTPSNRLLFEYSATSQDYMTAKTEPMGRIYKIKNGWLKKVGLGLTG
ncbi:hypothetical protein ACMD2_22442, partial [Ananas comosus]